MERRKWGEVRIHGPAVDEKDGIKRHGHDERRNRRTGLGFVVIRKILLDGVREFENHPPLVLRDRFLPRFLMVKSERNHATFRNKMMVAMCFLPFKIRSRKKHASSN